MKEIKRNRKYRNRKKLDKAPKIYTLVCNIYFFEVWNIACVRKYYYYCDSEIKGNLTCCNYVCLCVYIWTGVEIYKWEFHDQCTGWNCTKVLKSRFDHVPVLLSCMYINEMGLLISLLSSAELQNLVLLFSMIEPGEFSLFHFSLSQFFICLFIFLNDFLYTEGRIYQIKIN